jgi:hypothetical protein
MLLALLVGTVLIVAAFHTVRMAVIEARTFDHLEAHILTRIESLQRGQQ